MRHQLQRDLAERLRCAPPFMLVPLLFMAVMQLFMTAMLLFSAAMMLILDALLLFMAAILLFLTVAAAPTERRMLLTLNTPQRGGA